MPNAPVIYETPKSQRGRQDLASGALTREWFIGGTDDVLEVRDLLLAANPIYFVGLARKSIQWDSLGAPDLWIGTVEYGVSAVLDGFRPDQLTFKIGTAQQHVTSGLVNQFRLSAADVAQSGTNLTVDATLNTLVYPDDYTPSSGDVGKSVTITAGGGWTGGTYAINSIVSGAAGVGWGLASSPAAVNTQFGIWSRPGNSGAAGTNLTCAAATKTEVTPDGYTPSVGDVGNSVVVTGGTGWVPGSYPIVAVVGGKWLLSTTPSALAVDVVGGLWHLSGTAPDCQGAIGVTLDSVQGCDVPVPKCDWSIAVQRATVDFIYYRTCRSLVGKTNDAPFFGFGIGTLVYMGCEPTSAVGTIDDGTKFLFWNLAHNFAHEEDVTNFLLGNITVPKKGAWEYLWARYAPIVKAGVLVQNPVGVYVETVLKPGDFTALEIPGAL